MVTINWDEVGELLEAGCSGVEIAGFIGVNENTLYNRCKEDLGEAFEAFKQQKKSSGDSKLRTAQFDAAVKDKDRSMLIWLGKQRLGQKDKTEQDLKVEGGIQVIMEKVASVKPGYEEKQD